MRRNMRRIAKEVTKQMKNQDGGLGSGDAPAVVE